VSETTLKQRIHAGEMPVGTMVFELFVPGVDVLWLGHFDLTNFMGIPGQFEHPDFVAAVKIVVAAAQRHGKVAAVMASCDDWAKRFHDFGYRMFAYSLDILLYQRAPTSGIQNLRALR